MHRFSIFHFLCTISFLVYSERIQAQHTAQEFGFSIAYSGQSPFITSNDDAGFFRKPLIWNLRYQLATNYLQSISFFIEHVGESRSRTSLWPYSLDQIPYNAAIDEHFYLTTIGIETIRTLLRTDIFRLGAGLGIGYGFGGASAFVTKISDGSGQSYQSCQSWTALMVSIFLRGRYTLYETSGTDIAITGTIRAWGFPFLSPLADCTMYNGPAVRTLFETGYLAGISIGLK